ncbi:hypothetical protein [Peterkaempfera griseoplana]|uniref:hypothetical protein n=1 Tax=Peterkaempfera griseoplana TaxID=66896 RepID=UPI0006E46633|nr:hypothetical protein [Peterkaempfera griseoplana]
MTRTARPILRTAALASGVALGVAGCTSGVSHADGTSTSTPAGASAPVSAAAAQPAAPLTSAQLKGAALSAADIPPGFTVTTATEDEAFFASAADTAKPASCQPIQDMGADDGAIKPTATADNSYLQPANAADLLFGRIAAYRAGDAEKALADLRTALKSCTSYRSTSPSDGTVTAVTTHVLPAPSLGDGAIAFDLTGTSNGKMAAIRVTEIRVGSSLVLFAGVRVSGAGAANIPTPLMAKQVDALKAAVSD